eukprot:4656465-Pleurochrysis_carterae.AAC.1
MHPGPSGGLVLVADALRDAHPLAPSPPPSAASRSASFRVVAADLCCPAPSLAELTPPMPSRAVRSVALPSFSSPL